MFSISIYSTINCQGSKQAKTSFQMSPHPRDLQFFLLNTQKREYLIMPLFPRQWLLAKPPKGGYSYASRGQGIITYPFGKGCFQYTNILYSSMKDFLGDSKGPTLFFLRVNYKDSLLQLWQKQTLVTKYPFFPFHISRHVPPRIKKISSLLCGWM